MRRLSLWLVALSIATGTTALAQRGSTPMRANTKALQRIATSAEKDYKTNRAKALELARARGWVIEKSYKDGTHISLQGLDAAGLPIYYITYNNSNSAATTKTDQLWAGGSLGLSLNGSSSSVANKLAIWDGGRVRASHQELKGRITQKDNARTDNDHATHVAGTMIASGLNPLAKGMAFGYKSLQAYDFNGDEAEMAAAAKDLLVSNHSYGSITGWRYNPDRKGTAEDPYWEWWGNPDVSRDEDYKFGFYDDGAAAWDEIAYNAPYYLIVKSSGNNRNENGPAVGQPYFQRNSNGSFKLIESRPASLSPNNEYDIISTTGTAKNILTVGAISSISDGYNQPSDAKIAPFSSWGPTDDGRIKPDVVGNGISVLSTAATNDRSYQVLNGTSMSSPNVAGTMLLLQEHYANLKNGSFMRAATLKGLAIHTADEAGTQPGPDYVFGWGVVNAELAAQVISNTRNNHLLQERTLAQGQTQTLEVTASGAGPLKVTISWTDPQAAVTAIGSNVLNNRAPKLINDLDVRVSGNGKNYMPWTLNPAAPTNAAAPGDNIVDNVEQILVADAVPGKTYTITIRHKGTLQQGPQAYTLAASGVGGTTVCAITPTTNQGAKITKVTLGNEVLSTSGNCITYRDLTNTVFNFEPSQIKQLQLQLGSCGVDAAKIAKVYIDWNGNGSFADAGEEAAISEVVNGDGTFTANIAAPNFVRQGEKVRMRIVAQNTSSASIVSACGSGNLGETQDYLIQFVQPAKDVAITSVLPTGVTSLCASASQKVLIALRNAGASPQTNIPVSIDVRKDGVLLKTLTGIFKGTLAPYGRAEMLLEDSFITEANATYELIATATLQADAVENNNQRGYTFTVAANSETPIDPSAFRCGSDPQYTLSAEGNGTPYWYTSLTSTTPVAAGNQVQVPVSSVGTTLFAAFDDFAGTVGAPNKSTFTGGNYNQFSPAVLVQTKAPLLLEQARLYIGNSGKITFTVYDSNGAPVSARTLSVTATSSTPGAGVSNNDPADQGQIYYLGLELPKAGEYSIAISYEDGATIFRNNAGVSGYPFQVNNVFAITGNTATTTPEAYYYYFYDLKVRSLGCPSPRTAVTIKTGTPLSQPTITRNGQDLVSSAPDGNQWYLDGEALKSATGKNFTPTESGKYSVMAFKEGCVSEMSLAYSYELESAENNAGPELIVFPNPSNDGYFNYSVETNSPENLILTVTDMLGKQLYAASVKSINGQYRGSFDISEGANGLYIVRLQHGDKVYTHKVMISR